MQFRNYIQNIFSIINKYCYGLGFYPQTPFFWFMVINKPAQLNRLRCI